MAAVVQTGGGSGSTSPVTATWTSAPTNGNKLLAVVNSATTVTTPTGWTARSSLVSSQGFYVYEKTAGAGEATTLALTTSGNFPTSVSLLELNAANVGVFDVVNSDTETSGVQVSRTIASVTTTGIDGAFVVGIVAGHGGDGDAGTATPTWGNSFTALRTSPSAAPNSANEVAHFIGTRAVGTAGAIGSTAVNWSTFPGVGFTNTYGVHVAYKALGPNGTVAATVATATGRAPAPGVSNGVAAITAPAARATAVANTPSVDVTMFVTGGGPATVTATTPAPKVTVHFTAQAPRARGAGRIHAPRVTPNVPTQFAATYIADDGSPALLLGWWDGVDVQPVDVAGYWDGATVQSLA